MAGRRPPGVAAAAALRCTALLAVLVAPPAATEPAVLFDTHLHYDAAHAVRLPPAEMLATLDRNRVMRAVVTSIPPEHAAAIHQFAPQRIVPFLGVYQAAADKQRWHRDPALPERVARALAEGPWRGIGELHIFAPDRHSPVFLRLVELASANGLPLQMHADPAVLDALFDHAPGATVIWAHAGAYPYPPLLRDYLERYPNLYADLSMREQRIAPDGKLDPEWELLLMEFPDRFLVGVDTFSSSRWQRFDQVVEEIRDWLEQLPAQVAERIAWQNANELLGERDAAPHRRDRAALPQPQ